MEVVVTWGRCWNLEGCAILRLEKTSEKCATGIQAKLVMGREKRENKCKSNRFIKGK